MTETEHYNGPLPNWGGDDSLFARLPYSFMVDGSGIGLAQRIAREPNVREAWTYTRMTVHLTDLKKSEGIKIGELTMIAAGETKTTFHFAKETDMVYARML